MSTPSSSALTMINLCDISYKPKEVIAVSVQNYNRSLEVVWGPVEHVPKGARESASLIYIVKGNIVSQSNSEYTVVIRGTNFKSWDSWIGEDFAIGTTVKFNSFVKSAPATAVIAKGTATGLGYLINNSNDSNGLSPHVFLKNLGVAV
ncbi:MAG: hypothetical protein JNG86_09915, partial [Verrucomicrobiaceae bacterium]|nr:hypothetical protein [Verrucomicrobiaceae bacterium]